MLVDLHVSLDQGAEGPEALLAGAKSAGLDGLVLTAGTEGPDLSSYQSEGAKHGVQVFLGMRAKTDRGQVLCLLPDQGASLPEVSSNEDGLLDAVALIDAVDAAGGATVALRPYDRTAEPPMGDHLFSLQGLSACEVLSAAASSDANDLALEAASSMEMPCVGSSSASATAGLGGAATLLRRSVTSQQDLCDLIRAGGCWPVGFGDRAPAEEARRSNGGGGRRSSGGRRGGRGGQGGRRRRGPDDGYGNQRSARNGRSGPVAEDIGNRRAPEREAPQVADDIGNRLAPGEASPYQGFGPSDED